MATQLQKPNSSRPSRFPWYKERLKWKYINKPYEGKLCWDKWQFLSPGQSDFRTGVPAEKIVERKKKVVISPVIGISNSKQQKTGFRKCDKLNDTVYSKIASTIQRQQSRMKEAESGLQEHPFGLYPHLGESLTPAISDEIIRILDPALSLNKSSTTTIEEDDESNTEQSDEDELNEESGKECEETVEPRSTIYQFPLKMSKQEEILETQKIAEQNAISPEQEKAVASVMKDLVDWITNLGSSEENDINETKIKKLFASDYQRMPVLTTPIHVTEIVSNFPYDLHSTGTESRNEFYSTDQGYVLSTNRKSKPKSVKGKYGAWYLDVGLWKYRSHNEPLQDPKEIDKLNDPSRKAKNQMLDNALVNTHSAAVFKDFVLHQYSHVDIPKFLRNVGQSSYGASGQTGGGISRTKPFMKR